MLKKRSGRPWFCNELQADLQGKLHLVQVPTHLTSLRLHQHQPQAGRPLVLFVLCQVPCREVFSGHTFAFSDSEALPDLSLLSAGPTCNALKISIASGQRFSTITKV